ncbi:unnamed protein product, partial [Rotaria socialis]
NCAIGIAEASWNLHNSPSGIGYSNDKALGTDKHVFSVLGQLELQKLGFSSFPYGYAT